MEMKNKFFVCRKCGATMQGKRKPNKCYLCKNKEIGEIQIKWKS